MRKTRADLAPRVTGLATWVFGLIVAAAIIGVIGFAVIPALTQVTSVIVVLLFAAVFVLFILLLIRIVQWFASPA
jgi:hypothetical protein